jgi:hypothetical protein
MKKMVSSNHVRGIHTVYSMVQRLSHTLFPLCFASFGVDAKRGYEKGSLDIIKFS